MVTREELHRLVWSQPMTKVSEQYGVSGSYLARVCADLNVPRPPRGYWAKLTVGKAPPIDPLPAALPGDAQVWNEKGGPLPAAPPIPNAPETKPLRRRGSVGQPTADVHPLIKTYRGEFLRSRPKEKGGHLKPFKKLLPHVITSEACLDNSLNLASKLYNELEAVGARVLIAPGDRRWNHAMIDEREEPKDKRDRYYQSGIWSPARPTVAFFEKAAISLVIVEMTEDVLLRYVGGEYIRETEYQANVRKYRNQHTWNTTKPLPCGRLKVIASAAEASDWSMSWQDTASETLASSVSEIADRIRKAVPQLADMVAEERRQAEIRRREWEQAEERRRREEDRRRVEDSINQSRELLGGVIKRWRDRISIERFLDELSEAIDGLPEEERGEMAERLRLARKFMGSVDALQFFRGWQTPDELYKPLYSQQDSGSPPKSP